MKFYFRLHIAFILFIIMIPAVLGETVTVTPVTIAEGMSGTADIILDTATTGLSGYQMTITPENTALVSITDVTFPSWAVLSEAVPGESGSYALRAIDLNSGIEAGKTSVTLATLNLRASGSGTTQVSLSGVQIDDDSGSLIQADTKPGVITISGSSAPPATPSSPTPVPTTPEQGLSVTLNTGWNLINIPVHLSKGSDTAEIFKGVQSAGHSILTYDASAGWITIGRDDPLSPMTGYWIYTTSPISISLSAGGNPTGSKQLGAGWNLAGITGTSSGSPETALSGLASWTYIVPYDSTKQQYREAGIRGDSDSQIILSPYEGFWIYLDSPGTLTPVL